MRREKIRWIWILSIIIMWGGQTVEAQESISSELLWRAGLTFEFGTHVNRIGVSGNLSYVRDFAQLDAAFHLSYQLSHLGPRPVQRGWELQTGIGLLAGFGPPMPLDSVWGQFLDNLTGRTYAAGYGVTAYWDQRETSQMTATLAMHLGRWSIQSENDAYTGKIADRFRTGTFLVRYTEGPFRVAMNSILWTGDPRSKGIRKIRETDYPSRYGYKDLSAGKYGRFSHGILCLEVQYNAPFGQIGQGRVGIDAEQVRHFLQNLLIHDMMLLPPDLIKAKNPHYPMLDADGKPYLYKDSGQKVRKIKPYFSASLNSPTFY